MEEGDPRWRAWWDAMPREDLRLIAETVKRFLDSSALFVYEIHLERVDCVRAYR